MRIMKIMKNDTVDTASGITVSVWVAGCPHHCCGCHNPETWDPMAGQEVDLDDVIEEIAAAIEAHDIQRNLSILGGEPLAPYNVTGVYKLITAIKQRFPQIKIYLWTGYTYEYLLANGNHDLMEILCDIDVLIEGPYIQEKRDITLQLRGSSNQRIMIHDKHLKPMCFKAIDKL